MTELYERALRASRAAACAGFRDDARINYRFLALMEGKPSNYRHAATWEKNRRAACAQRFKAFAWEGASA